MILHFISFFAAICIHKVSSRTFLVDFENNCFLKDDKPFRYVSGSIHYFRIPPELWCDRMYKMKMAGLNAIDVYVEWNQHEPEPGVYDFEGYSNLPKFLEIASNYDLLVILRVGPFIDAERDMGGFPYWLLRMDPNIKLRTSDPNYIYYVDRWFSVLLPRIEPYLYNNGGPIITVQIENEYGSLKICDAEYKSHLRDFVKYYLKNNVVLFTTDLNKDRYLTCGKIDEVLATVDFGPEQDVHRSFEILRSHQPSGPLVNSEFYTGWMDHWDEPHANVSSDSIVKTLAEILRVNASVNFYVFHGGTSFGLRAGSNVEESFFKVCPTSYDYDAPINEAGDPTEKYFAIRQAIGKFFPLPVGKLPTPAPKMAITSIPLRRKISLWDYISLTSRSVYSMWPLSFEDLYQAYGFVVYRTSVNFPTTDPAVLTVEDIRDRGYVYVNKVLQGILSREQKVYSLPIKVIVGDVMEILVENQGRVCYGPDVKDRKGIFKNVTLGTKQLLNWIMTPVSLDSESLNIVKSQAKSPEETNDFTSVPSLYFGEFVVPYISAYDTFLRLDGWHKGVAFLNNFNLGRYWPIIGPQVTLYAPSVLFRNAPLVNEMVVLELEHAPCAFEYACTVLFVETPVLNRTTPSST